MFGDVPAEGEQVMKFFKLPDLGEGLAEAEIVEWKVSAGDTVQVHGTDCADGRDERDDNPILWRIGAPAGKTRGGGAPLLEPLLDKRLPMTNDIERDPAYSDDNLIWIDMEMTGLQPEVNRVLEVAAIITDKNLNILHKGPVVAVHQSDEVLDGMDAWNTDTHTRSGLVARVKESTIDEAECEKIFLETFRRFVPQGKSPMCGNTIGQDRRFMARWLPNLEEYFHYRYLDVSTLKELTRRWAPEKTRNIQKATKHQALSDIEESIEELQYYRREILKI
jgi:oligoribonuclease